MKKNIKEPEGQTHFVEVEFRCPMCGKSHSMFVYEEDLLRLQRERAKGTYIQDIFPDMSSTDREKFITGYCDECQKLIFSSEED